jgi:hypothetical protein
MKWNINAYNELGSLHMSPESRFMGSEATLPANPPLPWNPEILSDPIWTHKLPRGHNELGPDERDEWKGKVEYMQVGDLSSSACEAMRLVHRGAILCGVYGHNASLKIWATPHGSPTWFIHTSVVAVRSPTCVAAGTFASAILDCNMVEMDETQVLMRVSRSAWEEEVQRIQPVWKSRWTPDGIRVASLAKVYCATFVREFPRFQPVSLFFSHSLSRLQF